jgi:hypothetical protein
MNDNTFIRPMFAEPDGTVLGYMCAIDWECEIGTADGGNKVHPSVESLKAAHTCWEDCGIVEVRVSFSKLVSPPAKDYGAPTPNDQEGKEG